MLHLKRADEPRFNRLSRFESLKRRFFKEESSHDWNGSDRDEGMT